MTMRATSQDRRPLEEGVLAIVAMDRGDGDTWETGEGTTPPERWALRAQGCNEGMDPSGALCAPMDPWGGLNEGDSQHTTLLLRSSSPLGYLGKGLKGEVLMGSDQFLIKEDLIPVRDHDRIPSPTKKTTKNKNISLNISKKNLSKKNLSKNDKKKNKTKKKKTTTTCKEGAPKARISWQGGGRSGGEMWPGRKEDRREGRIPWEWKVGGEDLLGGGNPPGRKGFEDPWEVQWRKGTLLGGKDSRIPGKSPREGRLPPLGRWMGGLPWEERNQGTPGKKFHGGGWHGGLA